MSKFVLSVRVAFLLGIWYNHNNKDSFLGDDFMSISYEKLWNLLSKKGLRRIDLCQTAGITTNVMAKMGKNESVQVEVLSKICGVLECSF